MSTNYNEMVIHHDADHVNVIEIYHRAYDYLNSYEMVIYYRVVDAEQNLTFLDEVSMWNEVREFAENKD